MMHDIVFYEELSMNAHPALRTLLYDGWVLRFSNGYTNRANSINPLYLSKMPMEEKVANCERKYSKQELPTVFKLTETSPDKLDEYLDTHGYEMVTPTYVFINDMLPSENASENVTVVSGIEPSWREDVFRLNGLTDEKKVSTAAAMMDNIQGDVLSARIVDGKKAIACGLCVAERGYVGLYDIVVDSSYRQHGYGFEICRALLLSASENGAKSSYLQVVANNFPAIALYKKLGYEYCYRYWYRVKKAEV